MFARSRDSVPFVGYNNIKGRKNFGEVFYMRFEVGLRVSTGPLAEKTWILMGKLINNSVLGDMEINEIGKCFGKGRLVLK